MQLETDGRPTVPCSLFTTPTVLHAEYNAAPLPFPIVLHHEDGDTCSTRIDRQPQPTARILNGGISIDQGVFHM
jgi:hypothetical protein